MSIIKVVATGQTSGPNELTEDASVKTLENAWLRDKNVVEPVPGREDQASTGSSSLVRQMAVHQDELNSEQVIWVDATGALKIARTDAPTTQATLATGLQDVKSEYNQIPIVQASEHQTLVCHDRGTAVVLPGATAANAVMREAGLYEPTLISAQLAGDPGTPTGYPVGYLASDTATAYKATFSRAYGDSHVLESAASSAAPVRNVIQVGAGAMSRSGTTVTVTCGQPHGLSSAVNSAGLYIVVECVEPLPRCDLDFPPGRKTLLAVVDEYRFTYTETYGTTTTTNVYEYRIHLSADQYPAFPCAAATIVKGGGTGTITLPRVHGLTDITGVRVNIVYTTGMTVDAQFPAGSFAVTGIPTTTSITYAITGSDTSDYPIYVLLLCPTVPEAMVPQTFKRAVLAKVPIHRQGYRDQKLLRASPAGIDSSASWTRTDIGAVDLESQVIPGRGAVSVAKLTTRAANGDHRVSQASVAASTTGPNVFSVVAKLVAGPTGGSIGLTFDGHSAVFSLQSGKVTATSSSASAEMVPLGNGWYECSLVATASTSTVTTYIAILANAETDTYSGTSWYVNATINTGYVHVAEVSFAYGDLTCRNSLPYSEDLTAGGWVAAGVTLARSLTTVPGVGSVYQTLVTATDKTEDAAAESSVYQNLDLSGPDSATFSLYLKAGTGSRVGFVTTSDSEYFSAVFSLSGNGSVVAYGSSSLASDPRVKPDIVSVGSGWYRVSMVAHPVTGQFRFHWLDASESALFTGSNWKYTNLESNFYVAAPQAERGVGVSPYKATTASTTAAALTWDSQQVAGPAIGDTCNLYRAKTVADSGSLPGVPSDDHYLVDAKAITQADLYRGWVVFYDNFSSDAVLSTGLYTNPSDGDSEGDNFRPPVAYDATVWDGRAWLLNVIPRIRMSVGLVGASGSGLIAGDKVLITRADTLESWTFLAVDQTSARGPMSFRVVTSGTVTANVEQTAKNLIEVINSVHACSVKAYYSGADGLDAGGITLETKDAGSPDNQTGFIFDCVDTRGIRKTGAFSSVGRQAISDHLHNGLQYSRRGEPEAWPLLNDIRFGQRQEFGRRAFGFRDRMYVFGRYGGVFVVIGPEPYRVIGPISSAKLLGSRCVCEFSDQVWCMTDQGLGYITDGGLAVVSAPVDGLPLWRDLVGPDGQEAGVWENAFLVGDDSSGRIWLWLPNVNDGSAASAPRALVYSTKTKSWSTVAMEAYAAAISSGSGALWLAGPSPFDSNAHLATVRDTGTAEDIGDFETTSVAITSNAGNYYVPWAVKRGTRFVRSGETLYVTADATTNVPPHGYGPVTFTATPSALTGWTVRASMPVTIEWHPIDGGDFGLDKQFADLRLCWGPETTATAYRVAVSGEDGSFVTPLEMPSTRDGSGNLRRTQRVSPMPKAVANGAALGVRIQTDRVGEDWRLLGLRIEANSGALPGGKR